jgi:hypothetical protein
MRSMNREQSLVRLGAIKGCAQGNLSFVVRSAVSSLKRDKVFAAFLKARLIWERLTLAYALETNKLE